MSNLSTIFLLILFSIFDHSLTTPIESKDNPQNKEILNKVSHRINNNSLSNIRVLSEEDSALERIKLGEINKFNVKRNAFPILLFINLEDFQINNPELDITFNLVVNDETKQKLKTNMKGLLSNNDFIERKSQDSSLKPEFHSIVNGHFDPIMNYGVAVFRGKEIIEYETKFKKTLMIRIEDRTESKVTSNENILIKLSAMPSQSDIITLPQNEYFYSQIQYEFKGKTYNIYKLSKSDSSHEFLYLEYSTCYGNSNFAIHSKYPGTNSLYNNDTSIEIKSKETYYGKRLLVLEFKKNSNDIYIVIFPNANSDKSFEDKDTIHFTMKYFTFKKQSDYPINNIKLENTKIYFHKDEDNVKFSWEKLSSNTNDASNMKYYLRVYSRSKFKYDDEINSICLYNHAIQSYEIKGEENFLEIKDFPQGQIFVNLISKFNTGPEEHIFAYDGLEINEGDLTNEPSFLEKYKGTIILFLVILILALIITILCFYSRLKMLQLSHPYGLISARKKNKGRKYSLDLMKKKDIKKKNKEFQENLKDMIELQFD